MKKTKEGSGKHCVVFGCTNNSKKMRKWKLSVCEIHSPATHDECECLQPYQMHRIPNGASNNSADKLSQWLKNINRQDFSPTANSRVCSAHFIDGRPTSNHPDPVLCMGSNNYKCMTPRKPAPQRHISMDTGMTDIAGKEHNENRADDHSTHTWMQTVQPGKKDASRQLYDATITDHTYAEKKDPVIRTQSRSTQTEHCPDVSVPGLDDGGVKFFTGLSRDAYWAFANSLLMCLPNVPNFKLAAYDQLFLVLMRLRLGLMFTDLGGRFKISRTTACEIFSTWLPCMAKYMRTNLIFWPPRDAWSRIRPKSLAASHPNATCIIDCTEIRVQRPINRKKRAETCSNYKHYDPYKVIYCIAPNGFVTYVSKLFGGHATGRIISQRCGLDVHLLPGDEVLADRGFTISEMLPPGVKLSIPAFTRGYKDRWLPEECVNETGREANVRIHVERAIGRLKCFKLLSNVIPASVESVEDILVVCAGLCNLQPSLTNDEPVSEVREDGDVAMDIDFSLDEEEPGNSEGSMHTFDLAEVAFEEKIE